MKKILVTGATGNIGSAVIQYLLAADKNIETFAGVRNIEKARKKLIKFKSLKYILFDFKDSSTFKNSFNKIDLLFLLRPPNISEVDTFFKPLLEAAKNKGIRKVVFLSVQGAEKSTLIPHNKIERLITDLDFEYIFVRPSYFMQNLTTSLLSEIIQDRRITLPSSNAKFNWIDVRNIGEAVAYLINEFEINKNKAFEITGNENKDFKEVSLLLSKVIEQQILYKSINPIRFYFKKKKEGFESDFALVITILHFLPRFQAEPKVSNHFYELTGKEPTTLIEFLKREKNIFLKK